MIYNTQSEYRYFSNVTTDFSFPSFTDQTKKFIFKVQVIQQLIQSIKLECQ